MSEPVNSVDQASGEAQSHMKSMNKLFLDPMMGELEASMKETQEIFDNFRKQCEEDRAAKEYERVSKHIPEALKGNGQSLGDLTCNIENLLLSQMTLAQKRVGEESDDNIEEKSSDSSTSPHENAKSHLYQLDDISHAILLAPSLAALANTLLSRSHIDSLKDDMVTDTTLWVSRLFRFPDSILYVHSNEFSGVEWTIRHAISKRYCDFDNKGILSLVEKLPIIYISAANDVKTLCEFLKIRLSLPHICFKIVPCLSSNDQEAVKPAHFKMDTKLLEKFILADIHNGYCPLVVVAFVGAGVVGEIDDLDSIRELATQHNLFIHTSGSRLASMCLHSVPTSVEQALSADAITLNLSPWLGIPGLSFVTLLKPKSELKMIKNSSNQRSSNTSSSEVTPVNDLNCKTSCYDTAPNVLTMADILPLWMCLQSIGHVGVVDRIRFCIDLSKQLSDSLEGYPQIQKFHGKKKKLTVEGLPRVVTFFGGRELFSNIITSLLDFELVTPTILFRYIGPESLATLLKDESDEIKSKIKKYIDTLNSWLVDCIISDRSLTIPLECVNIGGYGICLRFVPLETAHQSGIDEDDITSFASYLGEKLSILDTTFLSRARLERVVEADPILRLVPIADWAGLGAVQYIPKTWRDEIQKDDITKLPVITKREISDVNSELVNILKSCDSAYSIGIDANGLVCIKFGLIMRNDDVDQIIGSVKTEGEKLDNSVPFSARVGNLVQESIKQAQDALELEHNRKLMEEGALRQIPVVSSLINWWSPPSIKTFGRTFNLASGYSDSTEKIYKYKIQVHSEDSMESVSVVKKSEQNSGANVENTNNSSPDNPSAIKSEDIVISPNS